MPTFLYHRKRPHIWAWLDELRGVFFDRRSDRQLRLDDAIHSVHNFDVYA